jgi:hypothetical protein
MKAEALYECRHNTAGNTRYSVTRFGTSGSSIKTEPIGGVKQVVVRFEGQVRKWL